MSSLLAAAGIGYVVSRLPLGAIAAAFVRLFFALLRPAAILFGAIKVYDWLIQKPRRAPSIPATPAVPSDPAPPF